MPEWTVTTKSFSYSKQIQKNVYWRKSRKQLAVMVAVSWLGLSIIVCGLMNRIDPLWILLMLVVAIVENVLLMQVKIVRWINHKQNQSILNPVVATVDSEKLHWKQEPSIESTAPWSLVVNYFMMDEDIVLFLNKSNYWYLPRTAFDSAEDWSLVYNHVTSMVPLRK